MTAQNKRLLTIMLIAALIIMLPLIAMIFNQEVRWSVFDFVVAGILLFGTSLLCELVLRKVKKRRQRIILCVSLLLILFFVWLELAVGIFGTPLAGD